MAHVAEKARRRAHYFGRAPSRRSRGGGNRGWLLFNGWHRCGQRAAR